MITVCLHSVVDSDFLTLELHHPVKNVMRLRVLETRVETSKPLGMEHPVEGSPLLGVTGPRRRGEFLDRKGFCSLAFLTTVGMAETQSVAVVGTREPGWKRLCVQFHQPANFRSQEGMERRGLPDWIWKQRAIQQAAGELRESLNSGFLHTATFVPVPPSRTPDDPLYDDRMTQVLRSLGPDIDVRELLIQLKSTAWGGR